MHENIKINLADFGGPVLLGREKARQVREKCNLDSIDNKNVEVTVVIPEEIFSIGSSFFLGVFGQSIRSAGTREAFLSKYKFNASPEIFNSVVENNIQRALFEQSHLIPKK